VENQSALGQPEQLGYGQILLLSQNTSLRTQLFDSLQQAGYRVTPRAKSAQVLVQLTDFPYEILVIDLDAIQSDPVAFMQAVRKLQPDLQLVILTNNPSLRTAITAIRVGTIDYLVMPVDIVAIVEAVQRAHQVAASLKAVGRAYRQDNDSGTGATTYRQTKGENDDLILVVPPARLDFSRRKAVLFEDPQRVVELSRGETTILACLMRTPDQPQRAEKIAQVAWKYSLHPVEAGELVRPYIFRLRQKLEQYPERPKIILTLRGHGYLFASTNYSRRAPQF
jgi:DNA-binding response OmpR family regulator